MECAYLDYIQLGKGFFQGSRFTFTIRPLLIRLEFSPSFPVGTIGNRSKIRVEALRALIGIRLGIDFVSQLAFRQF